MKKWIYMLIAAAGLLAGAAGCKKAPINSDVEGLWVLERFTVAETGETVECERLYYSITRMVTEVAEKNGSKGYGAYIGRTEYRNGETQLVVKDFKVRKSTGDSGQDAPVEKLKHFGIGNQQETVFDIEYCNGKKMTLKSDYARLELTKF
ncbi:lipocalin-like domain-containing protein [Phocaeicola plebeius]|uniref:lipocalin-like domain-containing protein n=1 Tax=Phocaeicola plebeius TaxID=310297 RepID=UPI00307CFE3E